MDINGILDIEKKYNLYTDAIDGVSYWMFTRFGILQYQVLKEILSNAPKAYKTKLSRVIDSACSSLMSHFCMNNDLNSDVMFICHPRRLLIDGSYQDIYTDNLAEYYDAVSVILGYNSNQSFIAAPRPIFYDSFRMTLNRYVTEILNPNKRCFIYTQVKEHLHRFLEDIANLYSINIRFDSIYKQITSFIMNYRFERDYCFMLLKKVNPKVLVLVVHYSRTCMLFCEVARKLGIKVIELQHGTMHPEHIAYHYRTDAELIQLPNYIFTFSDYWNNLVEIPKKSTKLITTGFPHYDKQREFFTRKYSRSDKPKILLFISQGTIGEKLSKFAVELSERLNLQSFHVIYKLHPDEIYGWHERYSWLSIAHNENQLEVVDDPNESIYKYFALSSIQVGVYSTAIYEGLGFGLDTYIYNISHASSLSNLVENGYAKYVNNVDEMVDFLGQNGSQTQSTQERNSYFWYPNAMDNIKNAIDRILHT